MLLKIACCIFLCLVKSSATKWINITGKLKQIWAGEKNIVGVNVHKQIVFRTGVNADNRIGNGWKQLQGSFEYVTAGDGKIMGVDKYGDIYYRTGVSVSHPDGTGWMRLPDNTTKLKQISIGDGKIVGVNRNGVVFFREGVGVKCRFGMTWGRMPGRLLNFVTVNDGKMMGVSKDDDIFFRTFVSFNKPRGVLWKKIDGKLKQISIRSGLIIGVTKENKIYTRLGVDLNHPYGTCWQLIPGSLDFISAGYGTAVGVDKKNSVFFSNDVKPIRAYKLKPDRQDCKEIDIAYWGVDIQIHKNICTWQKCQYLCLKNYKCNLWTWLSPNVHHVKRSKSCLLKGKDSSRLNLKGQVSGKAHCTRRQSLIGAVSGPRECGKNNHKEDKVSVEILVQERTSNSDTDNVVVKGIVIGVSIGVVCLAMMFGAACIQKKYRKAMQLSPYLIPKPNYKFNPEKTLLEQVNEMGYDLKWEFPRSRLQLKKLLEEGEFTEVWLAEACMIKEFNRRKPAAKGMRNILQEIERVCRSKQNKRNSVIVKTLKATASVREIKHLVSEIKILVYLDYHPNIINLLGACTRGFSKPIYAIVEYCKHGSLKTFLPMIETKFKFFNNGNQMRCGEHSPDDYITMSDMIKMCVEIAEGMIFLHKNKITHPDLAASNIQVADDYSMKISGFLQGRNRSTYSHIIDYNFETPIAWSSPESLQYQAYTKQSDVWSFGIVLWEIFSFALTPYSDIQRSQILSFIKSGKRLKKTEICPDEVYDLMLKCWEYKPNDRPTMESALETVNGIQTNGSHRETEKNSEFIPNGTDKVSKVDDVLIEEGKWMADRGVKYEKI